MLSKLLRLLTLFIFLNCLIRGLLTVIRTPSVLKKPLRGLKELTKNGKRNVKDSALEGNNKKIKKSYCKIRDIDG